MDRKQRLVEKALQAFKEKPYLVTMGANTLSERLEIPVNSIKEARRIYRKGKSVELLKQPKNTKERKVPKILIFDIETSPMQAYVWSRWKQNIYLENTISEWFVLAWAAKWLGEDKVYSNKVTPEEVKREDDRRIVEDLWQLLDEADIVVAHNGKSFDVPKMNARFIEHNLPPTSPYIQIDTKEVAAKNFKFSSNKLDALAGYFGIEHKDETDFQLWKDVLSGNQKAIDYMDKYCKKDTTILEKVYLRLRPWIRNHPNFKLYTEEEGQVCPVCGSVHLQEIDGKYSYTQASKFKVFRCDECGAVSRERISTLSKEIKKNLVTSV